jgi:GNAT superfamily N-acetyltransferase
MVDKALINRIDGNLFEFYEFAASAMGKRPVHEEGFSYVDLRPSPWARAVYDLDLSAGRSLPASLIAGICAEAVPNKVRIGPTSRPGDIRSMLAEAGFVAGRAPRGMTLDLQRRHRAFVPETLSLGLLAGDTDFSDLARIVAVNLFEEGPEAGVEFARLLAALDPRRAFGVLGSAEGMPVSAAYAFIDAVGVGGVYFVATEKAMRGRGYGSATVDAALDELGRRGVTSCILHATPLGKPVYEGLGFVDECALALYSLPELRGDSRTPRA